MVDLEAMVQEYQKEGYSEENADARVCQDIVLKAISESKLSRNVTIKGGVVMRSITGNIRRATQDMDLDFIRYSLEDDAIRRFVADLNCLEEISVRITGDIEELSQQEYRGKRVYVVFEDTNGYAVNSKMDLGVHKNIQIEQDEYCFDVCMETDKVCLLINSKEQIFAEKLRSLLKFGPLSTRYKDVFDLCYLADCVEKNRLMECLTTYILNDPGMRENDLDAVRLRVSKTFANKNYRSKIERSGKANWLRIKATVAFERIEEFLRTL